MTSDYMYYIYYIYYIYCCIILCAIAPHLKIIVPITSLTTLSYVEPLSTGDLDPPEQFPQSREEWHLLYSLSANTVKTLHVSSGRRQQQSAHTNVKCFSFLSVYRLVYCNVFH